MKRKKVLPVVCLLCLCLVAAAGIIWGEDRLFSRFAKEPYGESVEESGSAESAVPIQENSGQENTDPGKKISENVVSENTVSQNTISKTKDTQETAGQNQSFTETEPETGELSTKPGDFSEKTAGEILPQSSWAFYTLTEEEQKIYQEMYDAILSFSNEVTLSADREEPLERIFMCLLADHPEIFYVNGYRDTVRTLNGEVKEITFSPSYTMDEQKVLQEKESIDAYTDRAFAGMPSQGAEDDYVTLKYLYDYLIENTEYDESAAENQNLCSVADYGRSVCQGYAKMLQYLLQKKGIPAVLVSGSVNSGRHAWLCAQVNGSWYHVDPTWGDVSYRFEEKSITDTERQWPVNYDYFCVTTQELEKTHQADSTFSLPACTDTRDNYYVREGLYLTKEDAADFSLRLTPLFQEAVSQGEKTITFRCESNQVYSQLKEYLIDEQNIFRYLPAGSGNVAYTEAPENRTLGFWLNSGE